MAANKYTGDVSIELDGKQCTIQFNWLAVSALHSEFADELVGGLLDVGNVTDPIKLAQILAIGLRAHHPEITAEQIIEMSPPLLLMKKPLDTAIAYAYFGADLMAEVEKASELIAAAKPTDAKKKKKSKTR